MSIPLSIMAESFIKYYIRTITSPTNTFNHLLADKRSLPFGLYALLITSVVYTLVYVFLNIGGGQPFKPWLNIPLDKYYKYNVFFCAPSMFLGCILAGGVVHTLSRSITSNGTFEDTLVVFGFGISIASWTTGIHNLITSFLGATKVINQHNYEVALNTPTIWRTLLWIQMTAYLIWFIILFSKGTKSVYQTTNLQASLIGTLGFLVYQFFSWFLS